MGYIRNDENIPIYLYIYMCVFTTFSSRCASETIYIRKGGQSSSLKLDFCIVLSISLFLLLCQKHHSTTTACQNIASEQSILHFPIS